MRCYFCLMLMSISLLTSCQHISMKNVDISTVDTVVIDRYLGKWYEIARFPHRFEKDLIGVTATYVLRDDGKINVLNAGYKNNFKGRYKEAHGIAKIPDKYDASKLKVSFFLFFYADYFILELDTLKYHYAMVGSSSPDYLWILCRSPLMNEETYNMLIEKAKARGYQTEKLIKVEQKPLIRYEEGKTISETERNAVNIPPAD
jgi:apolipoprotein D and lipocalin family protein